MFPWIFAVVFVLIIACWIGMAFIFAKGITTIEEKGLKGLTEQVWCGKDTTCKLPEAAQ
jgi:ABC-type phosphate transport system permease subunit